jgi:parallel beta-helix repeat protein
VVNQPGQSRVEDNISIFDSSGTSGSPILIHDNYINGAYTVNPTQGNYSDGTYSYDNSYSGGGIMLGDGDPDDSSDGCAFVQAYNNTVINTTNYGIAITSGHDIQFYNNTVFSNGKLSDGETVSAQNIGAAIWNANGESSNQFYNDGGHDNQIEWFDHGSRNDWWVPSASNWSNNVDRTNLF